jgi:hypothetical protein
MIPAGVLDAGLASLATFGVGIFAVRYFEPGMLGSYALVFSAFLLTSMVSRELVYVPAEVAAVAYPRPSRLGLLPSTLRLGLVPAAVAAVLVSLWSLAAPSGVPTEVTVALTATAVACTFLSPVQDHLRRMLHIAGESWIAVFVSVLQVVGTGAALAGMLALDVPHAWIPFGALAAANLLSLTVGAALLYRRCSATPTEGVPPSFAELTRTGWYLLLGALLAPGSAFVAAVLVTHLAGAEALGYAEAARVLARPLPVLATGLAAVFRPLSIEAAQKRNLSRARRASSMYLKLFVGCGLLYLILAGGNLPWNPFAALLPTAYVITGLAAATIIGEIVAVIQLPYRYEMLGGGRVKALTRVEAVGATLRCATGATALVTYSFAMALGHLMVALARAVGYRRALREIYGEGAPAAPQLPLPVENAAVAIDRRAGLAGSPTPS